MPADTISLIGMPGTGKSTVGVILAKQLGMRFVDSDIELQSQRGRCLQDILEIEGFLALRALEEEVLLSIDLHDAVLATGGSAIYSQSALQRLKACGPIVNLETEVGLLKERINRAPARGIASDPALTLDEVLAERAPLYDRHATFTIPTAALSPDEIAAEIIRRVALA